MTRRLENRASWVSALCSAGPSGRGGSCGLCGLLWAWRLCGLAPGLHNDSVHSVACSLSCLNLDQKLNRTIMDSHALHTCSHGSTHMLTQHAELSACSESLRECHPQPPLLLQWLMLPSNSRSTAHSKGPRSRSSCAEARSPQSQFHVQSDRQSIRSLDESSAARYLPTSGALQSSRLTLGAGLSSKNLLRARAGMGILKCSSVLRSRQFWHLRFLGHLLLKGVNFGPGRRLV